MNRINLLSLDTSSKIAAGEVIERPASVVKELVENSIDANAKNITIEINGGGSDRIKVSDDGIGIHYDDIEKAFLTHGTSKISKIDDLYSINTFGFRGEALPSIASVSKVNLKSKIDGYSFGKEIQIVGGKTEYIKDVGCNTGTVIEVNDLFFNVPARKKFLKSEQREASLVSNIVTRLALANYDVSFKYYSNDKKSIMTFASKDVKDTIRTIYGKNIYDNIIGFEEHCDIASVYGYIGNSEISRGSRNNQSIFVNKRYIKSGLITSAVENAFKSFITINKFPFFVLFLEIYPELIDVNVHPSKLEIKFQDERSIYKLVFEGVHKALKNYLKNSFKENVSDNAISNDEITQTIQLPIDLKQDNFYNRESLENTFFYLKEKEIVPNAKNIYSNNEDKHQSYDSVAEDKSTFSSNDAKDNSHYNVNNELNESKFPKINIIGQFNNTYILGEACDNFYMIDQHAAHEKILFEKFKKQLEEKQVVSQILMTPEVVELNNDDYLCYKENTQIFKDSGFLIETFGDNTINIREAPMLLGNVKVKEFFLEILDNLKNMGSGKIVDVKYNMIASLACKAAIKANHPLTYAEMDALVNDLRYINEPFNCPHGRPTIIKLSLNEIEKKFKRIQ